MKTENSRKGSKIYCVINSNSKEMMQFSNRKVAFAYSLSENENMAANSVG
jgi:hypothetical protein